MNIRALEKTNKLGFLFFISYNGKKFDSFDEMLNKKSVKGRFREILKELDFSWAKGIQQGGRTDKDVSARENILYVSSNFFGDIIKLKNDFNQKSSSDLFIIQIIKTLPNLIIPDLIDKREYIYTPNDKYIINTPEKINDWCKKLTGTYDMGEFTDSKGRLLKNPIRQVNISYEKKSLKFLGDSFLPHQVRIMASYILSNEKKIYPGKFLTLNKLYLKNELKSILLEEIAKNDFNNNSLIEKIEKTHDNSLYIFYVNEKNRGEFIGKNGKNIKHLRKSLENILVREI
jgi:Pseudouridylate synthase